jgi:methylmalonyl-CoA mutase N-terminal domain/subunit
MGGTNSLHTNALDETLALPTDQSAEIALRTQSVLRDETGVLNVADPLGGSWYVEALTDKIEAEAEKIFLQILALGGEAGEDPASVAMAAMGTGSRHDIGPVTSGILQGIEDGWFNAEIAEAAFTYQQQLEDGTKHIVGVTELHDTVTPDLEILRISGDVEREQNAVLGRRRADRDNAAVERALADIVTAAKGTANLIEPILAAARAEATLGEICGVLREEWGEYRETTGL